MAATLTIDFQTAEGYTAHLTLSNDKGAALLAQVPQVLAELDKLGAVPTARTNGNGSPASDSSQDQPEVKVCPVHHAPMRKRTKHGESWWSHKAVDPTTGAEYWCRGNGSN